MTALTTGNTAKVYCLNWIENYIQTHGESIRILDVGRGTSNNFVELLRRYPNVTYVGVEPYASACEKARQDLQGENVKIINDSAYNIMGRLVDAAFDILALWSMLYNARNFWIVLPSVCTTKATSSSITMRGISNILLVLKNASRIL